MKVNQVRDFFKGKKTYITALIGLLGALAAWSDHQIDGTAMIAAAWAAVQACFLRAGIHNAVNKSSS